MLAQQDGGSSEEIDGTYGGINRRGGETERTIGDGCEIDGGTIAQLE